MDTMRRESDGPHQVPMSAEELLAKMRQGKKDIHEIRMGNMVIPVRVLSCDEVATIRREAIRKTAMSQGDETDKNLQIQKLTLTLASTVSRGQAPFLGDKIMGLMTLDELTFLYDEYIRVMETVNPAVEHIQPDIFRGIVDALKKNAASPKDLSLLQLRAICSAYVDLIQRQESQT